MAKRRRGFKWSRKKKTKPIDVEEALKKIYTTVGEAGAFVSTPQILRKELRTRFNLKNVPLDRISNWLNSQYSYTLHKRAKINFQRNPIIATNIDEQWQGDLVFFKNRKTVHRYIGALVVIDVVSRYLWAELIRNKSAETTTNAFNTILKRSSPRKPKKFQTDKGTEFLNGTFQRLMRQENIIHFCSHSDKKAALAERVIRTLQTRINLYMKELNAKEFYSVFQGLIDSYNKTTHSATKFAPASVSSENVGDVLTNLYGHLWERDALLYSAKPKFKISDHVRVSKVHGDIFRKGYMGNWSEEIFKIFEIKNTIPRVTYGIRDLDGNEILGSYYEDELQKIPEQSLENQQFLTIEKVLETKTTPGGKKNIWSNGKDSMNRIIRGFQQIK